MEISVDRYLDDGKTLLMTVVLRSRTTAMHSALTALDADQRDAVQTALARAVDDIAAVVGATTESKPE